MHRMKAPSGVDATAVAGVNEGMGFWWIATMAPVLESQTPMAPLFVPVVTCL